MRKSHGNIHRYLLDSEASEKEVVVLDDKTSPEDRSCYRHDVAHREQRDHQGDNCHHCAKVTGVVAHSSFSHAVPLESRSITFVRPRLSYSENATEWRRESCSLMLLIQWLNADTRKQEILTEVLTVSVSIDITLSIVCC